MIINAFRFGSAPLWTPADVTTQLWLDPSDAASRTLVGSAISQLTDKSGAGNTVTQGTSSKRPTLLTADLNGLDTASFDGSTDALSDGSNSVGRNVSALALAVLFKPDAVNADRRIFNNATGTSAVNARVLVGFNASSEFRVGGRRLDADSYVEDVSVSAAAYAGQWTILVCCFDYAGANLAIRVNGAEESSGAYLTSGSTSNTASTGGGVGGRVDGTTNYFDGSLAELIVQPSIADAEKLEGYLAHKWGLASLLPALHPYKSDPPTA